MCGYYAVGLVGKVLMLRATPMSLSIFMGVDREACWQESDRAGDSENSF